MGYKDIKDQEMEMHIACGALIVVSLLSIVALSISNPTVTGLAGADLGVGGMPGQGSSPNNSNLPGMNSGKNSGIYSGLRSGLDSLDEEPAISNPSASQAVDALMKAQKAIEELEARNVSMYFFKDKILEAQRSLIGKDGSDIVMLFQGDDVRSRALSQVQSIASSAPSFNANPRNFSRVLILSHLIISYKLKSEEMGSILSSLEVREGQLHRGGVNTSIALEILNSAREEWSSDRFDEAGKLADDTSRELNRADAEHARLQNLENLKKGNIATFGPTLLIGLVVLFLISLPVARTLLDRSKRSSENKSVKNDVARLEEMVRKAKRDYASDNEVGKVSKGAGVKMVLPAAPINFPQTPKGRPTIKKVDMGRLKQ